MTHYLGIDWLAMCLTAPAIYLLSQRSLGLYPRLSCHGSIVPR